MEDEKTLPPVTKMINGLEHKLVRCEICYVDFYTCKHRSLCERCDLTDNTCQSFGSGNHVPGILRSDSQYHGTLPEEVE
jgi:hypothetical protein